MKISANNAVGKNSLFKKALDLVRDEGAISKRITKAGEKTLDNANDILRESQKGLASVVNEKGIKASEFASKKKDISSTMATAMGDDFKKMPKWRQEAMSNDVTSAIFSGDEEVANIFKKGEGFSNDNVKSFVESTDKQYAKAEKSMARNQAVKEYFAGGENGMEFKNYARSGVGIYAGASMVHGLFSSPNNE